MLWRHTLPAALIAAAIAAAACGQQDTRKVDADPGPVRLSQPINGDMSILWRAIDPRVIDSEVVVEHTYQPYLLTPDDRNLPTDPPLWIVGGSESVYRFNGLSGHEYTVESMITDWDSRIQSLTTWIVTVSGEDDEEEEEDEDEAEEHEHESSLSALGQQLCDLARLVDRPEDARLLLGNFRNVYSAIAAGGLTTSKEVSDKIGKLNAPLKHICPNCDGSTTKAGPCRHCGSEAEKVYPGYWTEWGSLAATEARKVSSDINRVKALFAEIVASLECVTK